MKIISVISVEKIIKLNNTTNEFILINRTVNGTSCDWQLCYTCFWKLFLIFPIIAECGRIITNLFTCISVIERYRTKYEQVFKYF